VIGSAADPDGGHDSCPVAWGYPPARTAGGRSGSIEDRREVRRMAWEAPEFVEVRMDAEVTAYQGDLED
jgi:coenzyme PQQ precursor peptide PqqA